MLDDIVLDTNVLMHADNPSEARCTHSRDLLTALMNCATVACVDKGKPKDTLECSLIVGEYKERLVPGTMGFVTIATLASNGRLKPVSTKIAPGQKRWLERQVPDIRDRTFVRVAKNTTEAVLASHDLEHFPKAQRKQCRKELGVVICEASEIVSKLK